MPHSKKKNNRLRENAPLYAKNAPALYVQHPAPTPSTQCLNK
jgi:hypothetical protein